MTTLISAIEQFIAETGVHPQAFGWAAARNKALVERLRRGGRVWPETEKRVLDFIEERRKTQ
jgi:hypothetical protein